MTTLTRINTLFANDIHRRIEEVIKVDQTDEEIIRDEINEYVVTDAIRTHFTSIFEAYREAPNKPTDGVAIWVSGFFGSGKSSFAKMLGLAVANRTVAGESAAEQFAERAQRNDAVGYHAQQWLARLDRGEPLPTTLPYVVQSWSFGDELAQVFLAGEVVVDYALRLKRELDRSRLWVTAYANDVPCYIPSRRILAEGGYEAEGAMSRSAGPISLTALPSIETVPSVIVSRPAIILSSVDFPQPDGPTKTQSAPSGMPIETPFTASTLPA